ncbi:MULTISPECIES: SepA family multidrug efflux transporter [unclassified Staphylococcus]|uniref:SepA family multidrug efflux transporter n=1 Tax=unclassified Staphylococcus TaxID=91994 RepID=UPI0021CFB39F|nr:MULTISPECIES: SepA family multidrug efflux transporter [unclassified Staphylococcus]UXR77917.1 SepA family multidrug efflux transporter [Staphylococcus sp. IVB6227]UXR82078.1 SepA family multidrug efflux transporter [Staphylococcus sp. IVB6214]
MKGKFNMMSLVVVLSIFVISGMIFLILLAFGLYGLSRILIFLQLGEFEYNKGFYDNLIYYGSYILLSYFVIFCIEYTMDLLRKKLYASPYLKGATFHLITYTLMVVMFYYMVHIYYTKIHIDYWVLMVIIAFLYLCKEVFYPDSEDLNRRP